METVSVRMRYDMTKMVRKDKCIPVSKTTGYRRSTQRRVPSGHIKAKDAMPTDEERGTMSSGLP